MNKFNFWEETHSILGYLVCFTLGAMGGVFWFALEVFENPFPKTPYPIIFALGAAIGMTLYHWGFILIIFIIERIVTARKSKVSSNKEIEHE
jgi:hypothetical protein